jgi:molybdopterin biosynthesis enzyme
VEGPVQSQVRVVAVPRGLVRVDREAVEGLNQLPAVGVFTLVDGQAVESGEEVAGAKVTPVAIAGKVLAEAEELAAGAAPVVRVDAFRPLRTLVVVTERLKPKARTLFAQAVTRKLGWYGARLLGVLEVARSGQAVREAYEVARREAAEVVLFAGASSIDPLDAAYSELEAAGGELLRQGAPAHPGSMLWLGRLDRTAVLGVASCAGFGRNTALDLVLPFVFAYGEAGELDFRRLGYGGLVEAGAGRRFPPYP